MFVYWFVDHFKAKLVAKAFEQKSNIEVDYYFVCEKVINKDIKLKFISTSYQANNIFIKALSIARFHLLRFKLIVVSPPFSLRGFGKMMDQCSQDQVFVYSPENKIGFKTLNRSIG